MMELIWESKDMQVAIWRTADQDSFYLEYRGEIATPETTYAFVCWYAEQEFLAPGELTDRPFPAAA